MKDLLLLLILLCLLSASLLSSPSFSQQYAQDKKIVTISEVEKDNIHRLIKDIVRTAYKKIGIEVKFYELPARRALEWANAGKTDGDLARIAGTEKKYTNLIRIPIPVMEIKGVVFTKNIKRDIRTWEDLKGLNVGIRSGIRYSEIGTRGLPRIQANTLTQLFKLLALDRIDIALADYDMGRIELHKNFRGSNIHIIGQPLNSAQLFHYIHIKNRELVPRLESVLQDMLKTGEIESIKENTTREILSE